MHPILKIVNAHVSEIRENTHIPFKLSEVDPSKIKEGMVLVYAGWSGIAIINTIKALEFLYECDYAGEITILDIDLITPSFQKNFLQVHCHGWGEIFHFQNGIVVNDFIGKESFNLFKGTYLLYS